MANSASAIKRIELNERNRLRNKTYKSMVKTYYKKCLVAIAIDNFDNNRLKELIGITQSRIDKAIQKGIIHINHGSAKKAKLTKLLKEKKIIL